MSDELAPLSDREMELLRLLATGATNREIAQELYISVNTVKVHLRNIYGKLDVASRTEATMVAVREGWIVVPGMGEEGKGAEAGDLAATAAPLPERWPRVSLAKRLSLVVASLVAVIALFLPQLLALGANGDQNDPISGVFPTVAPGANESRWRTGAQMPTPRTDLAVVVHGRRIYAIGGVSNDGVTDRVEIYDPDVDAWTSGSPKPTAVGFVSAVALGDKIYVPGGLDAGRVPQNVLEIYDPATGAWEEGAPLPKALGAYGLATLDGAIYLLGGRAGPEEYVASVYRYDPAGDTWEELSPMAQARGFLGAAPLDDKIYVVGGYDDNTEYNACEVYHPAADSWTTCAPLGMPRGGLALVAVREQLYAIGGGMDRSLAFNELYDSRVNVWRPIETPVRGQWRGLGAGFLNPYLYAIGGFNRGFLSVNERYQALYQVVLP
ncbi:MAG: LuxR C-terminal-related transcriptional regulator [Anaerolineae bacterium]|nr:LuxR C-terminal-related transcriptional regulator [Anaerolineae bacterium]